MSHNKIDKNLDRSEVDKKIQKSRDAEYQYSYEGSYSNDEAIAEALLAIAESNLQIAQAINNQTEKIDKIGEELKETLNKFM